MSPTGQWPADWERSTPNNMQVKQDTFPAIAAISPPNGLPSTEINPTGGQPNTYQVHSARVIVTHDRVIIATDSASGPQTVFSEQIDPTSHYKNPDKRGTSYVTTLSGKGVAFQKDSSCGCGSRLRSWSPYRYMQSSEDPTE